MLIVQVLFFETQCSLKELQRCFVIKLVTSVEAEH